MKALLAAVGLTILGLGIGAGATLLGDRATLVPPPDARVEAFLRELNGRRAELAVKYLARELRGMAASELQHRFAAIERDLGALENVTAETLSLDRQSARVRGELVASRHAKRALVFGLRWEHGEWAIQDLPEALRSAREREPGWSSERRTDEASARDGISWTSPIPTVRA